MDWSLVCDVYLFLDLYDNVTVCYSYCHAMAASVSSERFEMCQDELDSILQQLDEAVEVKISAASRSGDGRAAIGRTVAAAREDLAEARKTLDQMEHEAKAAPRNVR